MTNGKATRQVAAERMVALASYLDVQDMQRSDMHNGITSIITAYENTSPELPAIAGYHMERLHNVGIPTREQYQEELNTLKKHMQKWLKM